MTRTATTPAGMDTLPGIDQQIVVPPRVEGETPQERFDRFHELNPHVYEALRVLARDLVRAGRQRLGINMLVEVLRWQRMLRTEGDDYKLNNNYAPFYARKLMADDPYLAGVFETRKAYADV